MTYRFYFKIFTNSITPETISLVKRNNSRIVTTGSNDVYSFVYTDNPRLPLETLETLRRSGSQDISVHCKVTPTRDYIVTLAPNDKNNIEDSFFVQHCTFVGRDLYGIDEEGIKILDKQDIDYQILFDLKDKKDFLSALYQDFSSPLIGLNPILRYTKGYQIKINDLKESSMKRSYSEEEFLDDFRQSLAKAIMDLFPREICFLDGNEIVLKDSFLIIDSDRIIIEGDEQNPIPLKNPPIAGNPPQYREIPEILKDLEDWVNSNIWIKEDTQIPGTNIILEKGDRIILKATKRDS